MGSSDFPSKLPENAIQRSTETQPFEKKAPLNPDASDAAASKEMASVPKPKASHSTPSQGKISKAFSKQAEKVPINLRKASNVNLGKIFSKAARGVLNAAWLRQRTGVNEAFRREDAKSPTAESKTGQSGSLKKSAEDVVKGTLNSLGIRDKLFSPSTENFLVHSSSLEELAPQQTKKEALKPAQQEIKAESKAREDVFAPHTAKTEEMHKVAADVKITMQGEPIKDEGKPIRDEMASTERTFSASLVACSKRLDALILIKEGRFKAEGAKVLLPQQGDLSDKEYKNTCETHLEKMSQRLEHTSLGDLKEMKKSFTVARDLADSMGAKLGSAKTNEEIEGIYKNAFSGESAYAKSVASSVANFPELSRIDPEGQDNYITCVQRLPRHVMLLTDFKNSMGDTPAMNDTSAMKDTLKLVEEKVLKLNNTTSFREMSPIQNPPQEEMKSGRKISVGPLVRGTLNIVGSREKKDFRLSEERLNEIEIKIDKATKADSAPSLKQLQSLASKLLTLSMETDPSSISTSYKEDFARCKAKIEDLLPKEKSEEKTAIHQDLLDTSNQLTTKRVNFVLEGFISFSEENIKNMEVLFDKFSHAKSEGSPKTLTTSDGKTVIKGAYSATLEASKKRWEENQKALKTPGALGEVEPREIPSVLLSMVACAKAFCKEIETEEPNDPRLIIAKQQLVLLQKNTAENAEKNYAEISSAVTTLAALAQQ